MPPTARILLAFLLAAIPIQQAGAADRSLAGSLIGFVSDRQGVPQMGAAVLLYNQYDRLVARTLTNEKGAFGFDSLLPGVYRIKVSLPSFVPAVKDNIRILPGNRSFLSISLASILSSVELIYVAPGKRAIMNDDWKWVLRTATPARPILRILPGIDVPDPTKKKRESRTAIFTRTRGLVKLSAGEEGALAAAGATADLGTSFALATSLFGSSDVQFSGSFGYALQTGAPTAGFRTSYSNDLWGARPEVALTMRQVQLRGVAGQAFLTGNQENAPKLQTLAVSTLDRRQLTDSLLLEYGASLESVAFLDRLNYVSPFARLTSDLGKFGVVEVAFSSGMPPAELLAGSGEEGGAAMQDDLTVLAVFPRVSLVSGQARVQRIENVEVNYRKAVGGRMISVGFYRESVADAAVPVAAPSGYYAPGDLLPDLSSNSSIFNLGDYHRLGFRASVSQKLGEHVTLTAAAGNTGVLVHESGTLETRDPDELRHSMQTSRRSWLAARISAKAPHSGLRFSAGYRWMDYGALVPTHLFLTSGLQPEAGLNIRIQQSLPSFGIWSGRMVASAELRNLLAQGYVPVTTADGRRLYLIQNPRTVRGGLSFIF